MKENQTLKKKREPLFHVVKRDDLPWWAVCYWPASLLSSQAHPMPASAEQDHLSPGSSQACLFPLCSLPALFFSIYYYYSTMYLFLIGG